MIEDLYSGNDVDAGPSTAAAVLDATILDTGGGLTVTVPAIDGGERGRSAHGTYPDALPGDRCWVVQTADNSLLVIGWEAN